MSTHQHSGEPDTDKEQKQNSTACTRRRPGPDAADQHCGKSTVTARKTSIKIDEERGLSEHLSIDLPRAREV